MGNMFQRKLNEIFKELSNVCSIADYALIVVYNNNGPDHDKTLCRVLQICRKGNLKLDKDKCHFRWTCVSFLLRLFPGKV